MFSPLLEKIEKCADEVLKEQKRTLIAVVGRNGTGKSYFGRYVRKNGFGKYHRKDITVIDDRIMRIKFLGFFPGRIKIPRDGIDELVPYIKKLPPGKKIIFYINDTPADKITKADILLKLTTDEATRRKRLQQRYGSDPEKLERYLRKDETEDYGVQYTYFLEERV